MNSKRKSSIAISILLSILMTATLLPNTTMAQETVTGTEDPETTGVWLFSAGTNEPAGAPTSDIVKAAIDYDILDYIGDSAEEVYDFGYGPSEPYSGYEDKTLAEVIEGLSAIDDFGYIAYTTDDFANFDTGRSGYFLGGFDPADTDVIFSDGVMATGELGPSGATNAEEAEEALTGYEIFIFEDAELSGMIITLSNTLGLSIIIDIEDLQVNPPTPYGADDTLIAIDLDNLPGFDSTVDFIETIRIQDDGVTSASTWGDTTLEIDAIATKRPNLGSIGDTVWLDENRDGTQDAGESGVAGVTVNLVGLDSAITVENGYYLFGNLPADTYTVQVEVPSGYENTTPTSYLIDLGIGEHYLDADFGIVPSLARLTIGKFNDTNGNSVFDEGVDVILTGWEIDVTDPHGLTTSYSTPINLDITDFGTYTITEDLPAGWEQTAVKVDDVYKAPPTLSVNVKIDAGEEHRVLYGNKEIPAPPPAKLFLDKFNDANRNSKYDAGEVKIADWRINVTDPHGVTTTYLTPAAVEITEFGSYTITEDLPDGWEQTVVEVDGAPKDPLTVTVTVEFDEGETHSVLYGNWETPPPVPTKMKIGLGIMPILQYVDSGITFKWGIDSPSEATPVMVVLKLIDPDGVETLLYEGTAFPDDFTGAETWTATGPAGYWTVKMEYYYTYRGLDFTARAWGLFGVRTPV